MYYQSAGTWHTTLGAALNYLQQQWAPFAIDAGAASFLSTGTHTRVSGAARAVGAALGATLHDHLGHARARTFLVLIGTNACPASLVVLVETVCQGKAHCQHAYNQYLARSSAELKSRCLVEMVVGQGNNGKLKSHSAFKYPQADGLSPTAGPIACKQASDTKLSDFLNPIQ